MRIRDAGFTSTTPDNVLYIYRVPTLAASCYGTMTAIEYCYRYSQATAGSGQVTFSYTVLILEDVPGNNFLINSTYTIQSRGSVDSPHCNRSGDQVTCCDVTNIENFILPSNFAFGVTSDQGNTNGVTLLGFHQLEYGVDVGLLNTAGLTLSVGSTIWNGLTAPRGIRMLWFIIGKHKI